jgi:hypothetical protein
MTSLAFGLGVVPLAISTGAGSGGQNEIGTGIVGGAMTTTLLGLFFVPLYFVTVLHLFKVRPAQAPVAPVAPAVLPARFHPPEPPRPATGAPLEAELETIHG